MRLPIGKPDAVGSAGRRARRGIASTSGRLLLSLIPFWMAHVCLGQEGPKAAEKVQAEPVQGLPGKAPPPGPAAKVKDPPQPAPLEARKSEPAAAAKPSQEGKDGESSPRRKRGFTAPPGPAIQATPVEGQADLIDVIRPKTMRTQPKSARPPN